jgi:hypothetical protein
MGVKAGGLQMNARGAGEFWQGRGPGRLREGWRGGRRDSGVLEVGPERKAARFEKKPA